MTYYVVHDADGTILRAGECPPTMLDAQAGEGEYVLPGRGDDALDYVDVASGEIARKRDMALTVAGTTISGLPAGTRVTIEGQTFEITDGVAELDITVPGIYDVLCEAPTYNAAALQVTVA